MTNAGNTRPESLEALHSPGRDHPANIELGATQPIDLTALMAGWDLTAGLRPPSSAPEQQTILADDQFRAGDSPS